MIKTDKTYQIYIEILKKELVPAMGCTEPISLAYCAAKARETLGSMPDKVIVEASGNIIKNVKSVIVPNTGGKKGIEVAAAAGIVVGNADKELEVLSVVSDEQRKELEEFLNLDCIEVYPAKSEKVLDIIVTVKNGDSWASVRIADSHTNIAEIKKDGITLLDNLDNDNSQVSDDEANLDYNLLNVNDIFEFANALDMSDIVDTLKQQEEYNKRISKEGLTNSYGAKVGQLLLKNKGDAVWVKACANAAAASDARMSGCELPVMINAGSGNQGITVSLPLLTYAEEYKINEDDKYRALALADLIALHLKNGIGRLSAYCGAVSAGVATGAGIAYMMTKDINVISQTIINAVSILSGMTCDGAKASCAAKIAFAVQAGIFGYELSKEGYQFSEGDGLVGCDVEKTIRNIGVLAKEGMHETDKTIISIMTE